MVTGSDLVISRLGGKNLPLTPIGVPACTVGRSAAIVGGGKVGWLGDGREGVPGFGTWTVGTVIGGCVALKMIPCRRSTIVSKSLNDFRVREIRTFLPVQPSLSRRFLKLPSRGNGRFFSILWIDRSALRNWCPRNMSSRAVATAPARL